MRKTSASRKIKRVVKNSKATKKTASKKTSAPDFKKTLISLAHGSGAILLKYFGKTHTVERKPDAGIVTEADKASEAYLLKEIFKKFPGSSIIAEESGEQKNSGALCWVIDPLDGTTNYAHGFPWFCVSIGVFIDGVAQAGVIYNPVTKELFFAEKGKGAFLNGKRIHVSEVSNISDALIGTGFYYSKGEKLRDQVEVFRKVNEVALGVRRPGSAALDLAYVACGRYEAFWEQNLAPWDVGAGFVIVEEAGGKITNYTGGKTGIHDGELIASNTAIHAKMLEIISIPKS